MNGWLVEPNLVLSIHFTTQEKRYMLKKYMLKVNPYLVTSKAEFYRWIPFAIYFTDHPSRGNVFDLARDSVKLASIEGFGVKRHGCGVSGLGAGDVNFSTQLHPRES